MPDLNHLLQEIDRLDQEATKGPWESLGPNVESADYTQDDVVSTDVDCSTYCYGGIGRGIQNSKDAEFIALARTALPQLAKALRNVVGVTDTIWDHLNNPVNDEVRTIVRDAIHDAITDALGADHE